MPYLPHVGTTPELVYAYHPPYDTMDVMARKKVEYDFSPNALFRAGPDFQLNACVGTNGGPYDLRAYGLGFFESGKATIEAARTRNAPVDVLVYPAAFAFRHAIELYLKHLLESLQNLRRMPPLDRNHSILEYFDLAVERLNQAATGLIEDQSEAGIARDIVADFHQIDPTGQVFRYPEDIKGNPHLIGLSIINVEVLEEGMAVLQNLLEHWMDRLDYIIELEFDARKSYEP